MIWFAIIVKIYTILRPFRLWEIILFHTFSYENKVINVKFMYRSCKFMCVLNEP
jgi:hypothetical protein